MNRLNYKIIGILLLSICYFTSVYSSDLLALKKDSVEISSKIKKDKTKIKKGWNVGPLPAIGYDANLGFQLGVMCDLYNYSDGTYFPGYKDKFSAEISYYTEGSVLGRLFYDSKYLIPNIRFTADLLYMQERMFDFYGYNGYAAPVHYDLNSLFYKFHRGQFRGTFDFSGKIYDKLDWITGIGYYNYDISRIKGSKYNDTLTLYDLYVDNGLIEASQAGGGNQIVLKLGVQYDSRDHEADPTKGIWTEAVFYGSPDIIDQRGDSYINFAFSFRHYVPLYKNKLTLAYRLSYQGTIVGNIPFYMQQNINTQIFRQTLSEGLGGMTSIRGALRNRIVGVGMAWANVELRYRIVDFRLFAQHWYLAVNPFFDAGMVVQPYKEGEMKVIEDDKVYSGQKESLHMSAGIGIQFVMNRNFVISAELGKTFDLRDNNGIGFRLGVNYLF